MTGTTSAMLDRLGFLGRVGQLLFQPLILVGGRAHRTVAVQRDPDGVFRARQLADQVPGKLLVLRVLVYNISINTTNAGIGIV